jgi:hypothetical protein
LAIRNGTPRSPGRIVGTLVGRNLKCCFERSIRGHRPVNPPIRSADLSQFSVHREDGDESRQMQGNAAFFDAIGEKAIANRAGRAHGQPMHNNSAGAELFAKADQA